LLTHTSGLPDIIDPATSNLLPGGAAGAWKTVQTLPMESAPGQRFSYNQTNYVVLEKIITLLSGEPFLQFIQHRQFDAVGMPDSSFGDSLDVIRNKANSYRLAADGNTLQNVIEDFPLYTRAGAGINSNARDLTKWILALQQGRLLKPASLRQLWRRRRLPTPGRRHGQSVGRRSVAASIARWAASAAAARRLCLSRR
jgi:CubicO group peptidase (beta-lactamase class C family)